MSDESLRLAMHKAAEELRKARLEVGYATPVLPWDANAWTPIEGSADNFLESIRQGQYEVAEKDAEDLLWNLLHGFSRKGDHDHDGSPADA